MVIGSFKSCISQETNVLQPCPTMQSLLYSSICRLIVYSFKSLLFNHFRSESAVSWVLFPLPHLFHHTNGEGRSYSKHNFSIRPRYANFMSWARLCFSHALQPHHLRTSCRFGPASQTLCPPKAISHCRLPQNFYCVAHVFLAEVCWTKWAFNIQRKPF